MVKSIAELASNRRQMLDVLEKNDSALGIQRLLTDLYPDSAHFVYELMQNAEDAGATKVEFLLRRDGVYFAHNGRREFTLDDVEAITAIGGNAGKRTDETAIGEFGVGFKAVFSYTMTPEVHSGAFHFRIKNHFLVELDDVPQRFLRHDESEHWTEFDFPFDNPDKPVQRAYDETLRGLERLDGSTLLFLRNISSIEYAVEGEEGLKGYARREEGDEARVSVFHKIPHEAERHASYLRYVKDISITSDRGKVKSLPVAIAYELGVDAAGSEAVQPAQGRTFIYFPAEKEHSQLKFHVNAPFSATVARDSIRDCEDNRKLMASVAGLVADSVADIKKKGLLNTSFYAVMPNNEDGLSEAYIPILDAVRKAFLENEYLMAKGGGFVRSRDALRGGSEFSDLLVGDLLREFAGIDRRWIFSHARNLNMREHDFLDTLGIGEFDALWFADSFNGPSSRRALLDVAGRSETSWTKVFYRALFTVYSEWKGKAHAATDFDSRRRAGTFTKFMNVLRETAFVRCTDGGLYRPDESYILPEGFDPDSITEPLVEGKLVDSSAQTQRYNAAGIREMLVSCGVETYSLEVELRRLVNKYTHISQAEAPSVAKDKTYYKDILNLARAHARGIDVDVKDIPMFIGTTASGATRFLPLHEMLLGDEYGNALGTEKAAFQNRATLHPVYARYFTAPDLELFTDFVKSAGIKVDFEIVECPIAHNPDYAKMTAGGAKASRKESSFDCTIAGLPDSLEHISRELAYELWRFLSRNGSTTKYAQAYYRPNARTEARTADSQLVAHLKSRPWLPDEMGEMHRPGQVKFQDLERMYQEVGQGELVRALDLGSEISAKRRAEDKLKSDAEKLGQHIVSDEDYQLLVKYKESVAKAAEKRAKAEQEKKSAQDYLDEQGRDMRPEKNEGLRVDSGSVRNPERRSQKIAETISDLESIPVKRQVRLSTVYNSDKGEREALAQWYGGHCQICDSVILRHDGTPYFEAINIIASNDLPERFRKSISLGWNSLCLCPNCAAKYRFSGKRLSGFTDQVETAEVLPGETTRVPIAIELAGRSVDIEFSAKHFIALREGMKRLDEE